MRMDATVWQIIWVWSAYFAWFVQTLNFIRNFQSMKSFERILRLQVHSALWAIRACNNLCQMILNSRMINATGGYSFNDWKCSTLFIYRPPLPLPNTRRRFLSLSDSNISFPLTSTTFRFSGSKNVRWHFNVNSNWNLFFTLNSQCQLPASVPIFYGSLMHQPVFRQRNISTIIFKIQWREAGVRYKVTADIFDVLIWDELSTWRGAKK